VTFIPHIHFAHRAARFKSVTAVIERVIIATDQRNPGLDQTAVAQRSKEMALAPVTAPLSLRQILTARLSNAIAFLIRE